MGNLCKDEPVVKVKIKVKSISKEETEKYLEMKCSICKQEGHNKRSCKKMTTPVSAPKNEAETDVKVEPVVKIEMSIIIDKLCELIATKVDKRLFLLRHREVIMWLFGDLSFLPPIEKKNKTSDEAKYKVLEDMWGQAILKTRRPDLKLDKQWTNKFGEHLCEEIYVLLGKDVSKPVKKEHYQPDSEVDDAIIEAKAGTFYTRGTAGEKILGCPLKYAEIPDLYSKPLKILCMGGAEKVCREQYGNLAGAKCSIQKKRFIDCFEENRIYFIGATDILKALVSL
jgi:hypothetical protein